MESSQDRERKKDFLARRTTTHEKHDNSPKGNLLNETMLADVPRGVQSKRTVAHNF